MRTRLALATGLTVLALLTACAPGATGGADDDGEGDNGANGGDGGTGGAVTLSDCLQGTWELDGQRQLQQLSDNFTANGMAARATLVEGGVTLDVDGDEMTYDSNITYTMDADVSGGLTIQVVQTQFGVSSGTFTEDAGVVTFGDWTSGIQVENTISMAGETVDMPIELPADTGTGVGMDVTCSGDALETKAHESPFTNYWARVS